MNEQKTIVKQLETKTHQEIFYPDSDCQPIADNTVQFRWIMVIYLEEGDRRQETGDRRKITWGFAPPSNA
ncbi:MULTISPECIES: hypothetical protein [unclassified Okeania]|uniref:hypothetical protein n=1 Tax=unclassified Okeania TaxID=2634635 RepID=UPI0025805D0E|nr:MULTISPECIES: hypothetical protein [unclassified Okeania]